MRAFASLDIFLLVFMLPKVFLVRRFIFTISIPSRTWCLGRHIAHMKKSAFSYMVLHSSVKSTKLNKFSPEYTELYDSFMNEIKMKNFYSSKEIFEKIIETKEYNHTKKDKLLLPMLSVCSKSEHLPFAMPLINELIESDIGLSEPAYLSLVKCYCDSEKADEALALIKQMLLTGIEPRLRTYHPIIDLFIKLNDPHRALELIHHAILGKIVPREEQIVPLVECAARIGAIRNETFVQSFSDLMAICSAELLGFPGHDLLRITAALTGEDLAAIEKQGVLVESEEVVIEKRTEYSRYQTNLTSSSEDHLTANETTFSWMPENYTVASTTQKSSAARIVDISSQSCRCPNCGGALISISLTEGERKTARYNLMRIVATRSINQLRNLQVVSPAESSRLCVRALFRYSDVRPSIELLRLAGARRGV